MKNFVIYQKGIILVYIHEGRIEKGHKLPWYGIRRNDSTGLAEWLGVISFNGGWRQFTTKFEPNIEWSSSCKKKICKFEDILNKKWRDGLHK